MKNIIYSQFKSTAILAANKASAILLHYYGERNRVSVKSNKSFVSTADLKANDIIVKSIKSNFPNHDILSEESVSSVTKSGRKSDYRWIIDPLDGTHNFLHEIPIFGTSIALERRNEIILGVMHFPALNLTAIAEKNKGAFLNGKRIHTSGRKTLERSMILFEFPYKEHKNTAKFMERLSRRIVDLRDFGSAIYHLLLVASGRCDGYITITTNEWDVAAGYLCVLEAGGIMTDFKGKNAYINNKSNVISNGKINGGLVKALK